MENSIYLSLAYTRKGLLKEWKLQTYQSIALLEAQPYIRHKDLRGP